MKTQETTVDDVERERREVEETRPGVVLVYSIDRARLDVFPLEDAAVEIGRTMLEDDERVSRRHARVRFENGRWSIQDLESRNGTFVDGMRVFGTVTVDSPKVVRIGRSLVIVETNGR